MKHNHGTTSNTDEVFRTFIGEKVKGILHGFGYGHSKVILVFDCGWGLCFNSNGSHWVENPSDIKSMTNRTKRDLADNNRELEGILHLAG